MFMKYKVQQPKKSTYRATSDIYDVLIAGVSCIGDVKISSYPHWIIVFCKIWETNKLYDTSLQNRNFDITNKKEVIIKTK